MTDESNQPILHAQLGDILELHGQIQGLRSQLEDLTQQTAKITIAVSGLAETLSRQVAVIEKLAGVRR